MGIGHWALGIGHLPAELLSRIALGCAQVPQPDEARGVAKAAELVRQRAVVRREVGLP